MKTSTFIAGIAALFLATGGVPLPRSRPDAPVLTYPGESFDAWERKTRSPVPHQESQRYFSAKEAFPGLNLTPAWMMTTRGSRAAGAPSPTPGSLPHAEMLPVPTDLQIARAAVDRTPVYTRDGRAMAPYSTMPLPGFEREAFYNFLRNQPPSTNIEDRRGEIQPTLQPGEKPAMQRGGGLGIPQMNTMASQAHYGAINMRPAIGRAPAPAPAPIAGLGPIPGAVSSPFGFGGDAGQQAQQIQTMVRRDPARFAALMAANPQMGAFMASTFTPNQFRCSGTWAGVAANKIRRHHLRRRCHRRLWQEKEPQWVQGWARGRRTRLFPYQRQCLGIGVGLKEVMSKTGTSKSLLVYLPRARWRQSNSY